MRNLIYRLRQTFGLISDAELIVSTASGYQFNPKIHIIADYQQFDEFIRLASAASSIINRVELLKSALISTMERYFLLRKENTGLFNLQRSTILHILVQ